ncbi:hypothetical protein ARMGADRAFT_1142405 [Armillaria gallica]|uniref:F-box domain-containing protein n=1 Tax=Armillaria gallica TaxID=47427 RepID=A0A2H3E5R4_ARMGA|nr:hypothetical protein ARMGADRAFT_1142405 [Armillaria gallica]
MQRTLGTISLLTSPHPLRNICRAMRAFPDIGPRRSPSAMPYGQMCERRPWERSNTSRIYIYGRGDGVYDGNFPFLLHHLAFYRVGGQNPVVNLAINDLAWSDLGNDRTTFHNMLISFPNIGSLFLQDITCSHSELCTLLGSYSHLASISIQGLTFDDFPTSYSRMPSRPNPSINSLTLYLDYSSTSLLRFLTSHSCPLSLYSVKHLEVSGVNGAIPGTDELFACLVPIVATPIKNTLIFRNIAVMSDVLPSLDITLVSNLTFALVLDHRGLYRRSIRWWAATLSRPSSALRNVTICIDGNAFLSDEDRADWHVLDSALCGKDRLSRLSFQLSVGNTETCVEMGREVLLRLPEVHFRHARRLAWLDENGTDLRLDETHI